MTNRTDAQAALNALIAKQGTIDSITPTNLANDQFQVLLDSSLMIDEESSGGVRTPLAAGTFGDFDNFTAWSALADGKYRMTASASQISNGPPVYAETYDFGGGIFYIFDIDVDLSTNFTITMVLGSDQDLTNPSIGRVTRRVGTLINAGSGEDWIEYALLADSEQPQFLDARSFVTQGPTTTDTIHNVEFGAAQNVGGDVELFADGTIKWNKTGNYTIDISVQPGRTSSPQTAELILYGAVNVSTDGNGAPDTDYFQSGRAFAIVMDDQNTAVPLQFTNHYLNVSALPFSIRYVIQRSSSGANDGSLFAVTYPVGMTHAGNAFPQSSTASAGLSVWRNGQETSA